ncbi:hypothetical protein NR798_45675 [Archangium gephyra]|uniref:hypothetical protein n=1 Tax=Archangium gephyra TaxID=48 RepID=UPI0035D3F67E
MRYFKRPWEESRGDEYDAWGTSIWYLELDEQGGVARQLEIYENGTALKYDASHLEDRYGGLSDATLDVEEDGFAPFEIECAEFESTWQATRALNRKG